MTDDEMKRLQKLYDVYHYAATICPPDEYYKRQRELLHGLAEFILKPLFDKQDAEEKENAEAIKNVFELDV